MSQQTLLIIDGHALAYRYFFALERSGMKTADDRPIWAVYGFFKCIFDLLNETKVNPDLMAVTFDVGRHTYRVDMYPEYKANRESMPDSMHLQLSEIIEGLNAFNIPIFTKEGFEADDLIGTISEIAKNDGIRTMILTGDRDSFQLVDDKKGVSVIMPSKGEIVAYNRKKVFERMGIYPEQVVDFKALAGDTSDNIPGIRGIGDKTAAKLLSEYGTLDDIYKNLDSISGKSLKQKLADGKENAYLSRELATIQRNVQLDFNIKDTCLELPDKQKVLDFFRKNSFYSFLKSADEILSHFSESDSQICQQENVHPVVSENGQLGLFQNEIEKTLYKQVKTIVDSKEKLDNLVENLKKHTLVSVDTETTGINPLEDDLVGISLAFSDAVISKNQRVKTKKNSDGTVYSYYIPLFHSFGEQLDFDVVQSALAPVFSDEKIAFTMQNAKFDLHVLKRHDMPVNNLIFDTMIASYINDSSRKHGLKNQSELYLGYIMQNFDEVSKNKNFSEVQIDKAAEYSCDDAFATLLLTEYWTNNLSEKELDVLYNIDVPLIKVLLLMEETGVSVDTKYLENLSDYAFDQLSKIEMIIFEQAGESFNINSPRQVSDILFQKLGLKLNGRKISKKNHSTKAQVLESLAEEHQIARDILEYRHLAKLKSTYIDTLPELISPRDGRIHTSFNQTITATGRLSSSNPNLQNIPARTEFGSKIRGAFVPKDTENYQILSADYSQIELRLMAHCTQDENLLQAFYDDVDVHTQTAAKIYGIPTEAVTKEMRSRAKAVNFGIIYGQSKYGLASSLGISTLDAEDFIMKYFATYPKVKEYMYNQVEFAIKYGYVETIFGRRRKLDLLSSASLREREAAQRAAINSPIQGSAADLIKLAMVKLQKLLSGSNLNSKIIIQVHDELVLEMLNSEKDVVIEMVRESMENVYPLTVPLKVDIEYGKNLLELK